MVFGQVSGRGPGGRRAPSIWVVVAFHSEVSAVEAQRVSAVATGSASMASSMIASWEPV